MQAMRDSIRAQEDGNQTLARQTLAQYSLISNQQVSAFALFSGCRLLELQKVPIELTNQMLPSTRCIAAAVQRSTCAYKVH